MKLANLVRRSRLMLVIMTFASTLTYCSQDEPTGKLGFELASPVADFYYFDFDASVEVPSGAFASHYVESQLLYMVGQLNGYSSVSDLNGATVNVTASDTLANGNTKLGYRAKVPVAWGHRAGAAPTTFELLLPRSLTFADHEAFTAKYKDNCVDWSAHDVDSGNFFYYYRPNYCSLDNADIVRATATLSAHPGQTTGKYPEYDKMWSDGAFRMVAIFGRNEVGTGPSDAGASAYTSFNRKASSYLNSLGTTTVNNAINGTEERTTYQVTIDANHAITLDVFLIDGIRSVSSNFSTTYATLTLNADFIAYNGHAGLGANIRALARMGNWKTGQYASMLINGCDTYAYVDSALFDAHAAVNSDDPQGTKYLDLIMNAMPAYFHELADENMVMLKALANYNAPKTYEQILRDFDDIQVALVSGEEDNVYTPTIVPPGSWADIDDNQTVASRQEVHYAAENLEAGSYTFILSGSGDADLYVHIDNAPTTSNWTCRPYVSGSDEACTVTISAGQSIYAMVRGWNPSSDYRLLGKKD